MSQYLEGRVRQPLNFRRLRRRRVVVRTRPSISVDERFLAATLFGCFRFCLVDFSFLFIVLLLLLLFELIQLDLISSTILDCTSSSSIRARSNLSSCLKCSTSQSSLRSSKSFSTVCCLFFIVVVVVVVVACLVNVDVFGVVFADCFMRVDKATFVGVVVGLLGEVFDGDDDDFASNIVLVLFELLLLFRMSDSEM